MYTATVLEGSDKGRTVRFRTVSGLVNQLGGNDWHLEHSQYDQPPTRTVRVLRKDRHGTHVVTHVTVPGDLPEKAFA